MERIYKIIAETLAALANVRQADDSGLPDPASLHQALRTRITRAREQAIQLGVAQNDADDITYALVALADEVAIARTPLRDAWLPHMLQIQLFQENNAGEGFFQRLEAAAHSPGRLEVLAVYYVCLLFGFRGRYSISGAEIELQELVDSVRLALTRGGMLSETELSPHAKRPSDGLVRRRASWGLVWAALGVLTLSVLFYFGLRLDIAVRTTSLVEELTPLTGIQGN